MASQNPPAYAPPGYPPAEPQAPFQPPPQPQVVHTTTYVVPEVVAIGTCPHCKAGVVTSNFTCCGIALGIIFFPIGILCCWFMRDRRCSNCRHKF